MTIVDEITLPDAEVDGWLDRWRAEYAPAARARGLELVGVWVGGTRDPRHRTVMVHWRVASVRTFWSARMSAGADTSVAAFWAATDAIAVARDRRVLRPVEVG